MILFRLKYILFFYLHLFLCSSVAAQVGVKAKADPQNIQIGDHIRFFLEARSDNSSQIWIWPVVVDSIGGLEVLETGKIDTLKDQGDTLFRQRILLSAYDSGHYILPELSFTLLSVEDSQIYHTDPINISVQTIPVDTTQPFKPVKDIIFVESHWLDYWYIYLAALLLIGLGIFVWFYFYKNRGSKVPDISPKAPPEKAHEKAIRKLNELNKKRYWERNKIKEYYSELSEITREYIEERFNLPALEITTAELLQVAKRTPVIKRNRSELKLILRTADLVKFAKANPLTSEHEACMDAALKFVTSTILKSEEGEI